MSILRSTIKQVQSVLDEVGKVSTASKTYESRPRKPTSVLRASDGDKKAPSDSPSDIVKPGQTMVIRGEGMPVRKAGAVKQKGDMTVKWEVVFPDRLTAAQKEGIQKVLG